MLPGVMSMRSVRALFVAGLVARALGDLHAPAPAALEWQQQPVTSAQHNDTRPRRVAIVGAGAAGSSAAHHLRRFADEAGLELEVVVYEREARVGGRSTTVRAFDEGGVEGESGDGSSSTGGDARIELGASVFVQVNRILWAAAQEFNLSLSGNARASRASETLGVWDGRAFALRVDQGATGPAAWWQAARLVWRYRLAPWRAARLSRATVDRFLRMYEAPTFPWRDGLTQAAFDVGLADAAAAPADAFLARGGAGGAFAREAVQAATRVNYAQNLGLIHGLEATVCLAAEGAVSVEGGNWQIFANFLNASAAEVRLGSAVTKVVAVGGAEFSKSSSRFQVHSCSQGKDCGVDDFDAVVLAAPFHQTAIEIEPGLAPAATPNDIEYVRLHVTLFASPRRLSPAAFGLGAAEEVPEVVLTTLPPEQQDRYARARGADRAGLAGFFSISTLMSATNPRTGGEEYIYKIFSPEPIGDASLAQLLGYAPSTSPEDFNKDVVSWIHRKNWLSYPFLPPRITFEGQELQPGLWYTSGIESFISTMETSALSGKSVAKLIINGWTTELMTCTNQI